MPDCDKEECLDLRESVRAVQEESRETRQIIRQVDNRVDTLTEKFGAMSNDVSQIKGCLDPLCKNVESITKAIVEKGISGNGESKATSQAMGIVKLVVIVSGLAFVLASAGYFGLQTTMKHNDSEIKVQKAEH